MARIAIIGSCITRDLWPILGEAPADLLYISRTSFPSLFSAAIRGVKTQADPTSGLGRHQHNAAVADIRKTALNALVAHRPTHIIFDFIDERFDLLAAGDALATYSWELETTGYMAQGDLAAARRIARTSGGCERLWNGAVAEMGAFLASTPLRDATLILHSSRWADRYRTTKGAIATLNDETVIWEGRPARRSDHNELLERYERQFLQVIPGIRTVAASQHRIADEAHRWGLSPFHYVPAYYDEIRRQLESLGV